MVLTHLPVNLDDPVLAAFFDRLQCIYAAMDRQYTEVAKHYGFHCDGCEDNCCRTRFYHHTYLEYLDIHSGLNKLGLQRQREIQSRAALVCRETAKADEKAMPVRLMCPLNSDGRCTLYRHRPMICRLHGISHELRKPGQNVIRGPGCRMFDLQCSDKRYLRFDRTPFYFEMAKLESELKQAVGLSGRVKMTIAEMIVSRFQRSDGGGQKSEDVGQRIEIF
jgi:Fe-S-cluster containining protein